MEHAKRMTIKVLEKADRILGRTAEAGRVSFTELQTALGWHKATLSHLLKTMTDLGWLDRDPDGRFRIGARSLALTERERGVGRLHGIAADAAHRLGVRLNEFVAVVALRGDRRQILAFHAPDLRVVVNDPTGRDSHFDSTATGRILLAFATDAQRDRILQAHGLPKAPWWPGAQTKASLSRALAAISRERYAECASPDGEAVSLGVPVFHEDGSLCAAIGVTVPRYRLKNGRKAELLKALHGAAAEFEETLQLFEIGNLSLAERGGKT